MGRVVSARATGVGEFGWAETRAGVGGLLLIWLSPESRAEARAGQQDRCVDGRSRFDRSSGSDEGPTPSPCVAARSGCTH